LSTHLKAVDSRQSDVEHHKFDRVTSQLDERLLSRANPQRLVTGSLQIGADQRTDVRLVLHHHDRHVHTDIVGRG